MFKVMAIADIHLRGGIGTDEADALIQAAHLAGRRDVKVVLVNGDVYEATSTPAQRLIFQTFLELLGEYGITAVVLRGNHDQKDDLAIFHGHEGNVFVHEEPDCLILHMGAQNAPLQILTIPHFNAGAIALQEADQAGTNETGTSLFDRLLDDYFNQVRSHEGPSIVAFHGTISGAALDNGHIPKNNGIHLNMDRLNALGCPVVGGHYHRCQQVGGEGSNVWYSGSITRQTFGESEGDKGVLLLEHDGEEWLPPEFVSLEPVPMVLIEAEWQPNGIPDLTLWGGWYMLDCLSLKPEDYAGSRVRFRYSVAQVDLPTVKLDPIRELFAQARDLKIEQIVEVTTAVRVAEMAEAASVEDCFRVWGESKEIAPETLDAALELLKEVTEKEPAAAPPALQLV